MTLVRSIALVAAMWVMLGCGDTVEDSARRQGISREDARDIIRSLRAEKHPHAIYQFDRVPSASFSFTQTSVIFSSSVVRENGNSPN
jgi:hypothetical protein